MYLISSNNLAQGLLLNYLTVRNATRTPNHFHSVADIVCDAFGSFVAAVKSM